ncbi:MAG TPA: PKD domain-containing protein [Nocardioides sp.]|nr:PKD domain-containing protein [Nocardioides sp.]
MRRSARKGMLVTVVALVGALAPVGDVAAAPTWLPAGAVAPAVASGEAGGVDLDAAGNAVAVWTQATGGEPQVVASSRPAGGSWGAPVPLSLPGAAALHPQVVLGGDGRATAVWFRATGPATYGLQSSTRSVGGVWTPPLDLPGDTSAAAQAALVVRPGASTVVAWPRTVGGSWSLSTSTRTATGSWSTPVDLSSGSPVMPGRPRLAVDGSIMTTAVWSVSDGARWTVRAASAPLGGTWSAPVTVSPTDQDAVEPDLAVAGNGTTMAVWARWNGADRWVAQASTRPAQQTGWSGPADLSASGFSVDGVEVATNTFGSRFVATWTATPTSGPSVVQAAVHQEGAWRPAVTLSDPATASSHPTAVVSATAPATVTWLGSTGSAHVVQSAVLPAYANAFSPLVGLSSSARDAGPPRLGVGLGGDVLVFWGESGPAGPSAFQPRYAAYDVAGPAVTTFRLAGRAVAGHPATYEAAAVDAWSPVATYSWRFGDGVTATSAATTHAFAAPGRYTVRFRVTDAVGNSSVRVARTKVIAAPAITTFTLAKRRISLADKARIRIGLNVPAKVKLVLRSKQRHRVDGVLHRQKLVVRRELDAGRSTVVLKGSRLLADTWVVTGAARTLGVDSATVKKRLVVVRR